MKIIELTQNKFTIVDTDIYEILKKYNWQYATVGYAVRSIWLNNKNKSFLMHREIYEYFNDEIPPNMVIDHINHNKLDNRIDNLRLANKSQNNYNRVVQSNNLSSDYKGVSKNKQTGNWVAYITSNYKRQCIGSFTNEIACANAYNYHAKKLFGEYALLNDVKFMNKEEFEKYQLPTTSTNNYKGVLFRKDSGKWRIRLTDLNGKRFYVGTGNYKSEDEALNIRNNYLIKNPELLLKYDLNK